MRKIALVFVLAVALAALIYDYTIARPNVEQAYERIATQSRETNRSANPPLTNEQVRALLGKPPVRIFRDRGDQVEVYSWIAGLPFHTHDLYVVFRETGQSISFQRHFKFVYESHASLHEPLSANERGEMERGKAVSSFQVASEPNPNLDSQERSSDVNSTAP